jgi:hypothetical protein
MKLDIRTPLGLLFVVLGLLLAIFGAASQKDLYARSLGININLWWGLVLIVFGGSMLLLARWSHRRAEQAGHAPATTSSGKGASGHE